MGVISFHGQFDPAEAGEKLGIIVGGLILLALIAALCNTLGTPPKCGAGSVECSEQVSPCGCCSAQALQEGGNYVSLCSCPTGYTWKSEWNDCCREIADGVWECINTGRHGQCTYGECPVNDPSGNCPASGCCYRGTWSQADACCKVDNACVCPPSRNCDMIPEERGEAQCTAWGGCCGEGLNWNSEKDCCIDERGQCVDACAPCLHWERGACRDANGNALDCPLGVICSPDGTACCRDECGGCVQQCPAGTEWDCNAFGGAGCCVVAGTSQCCEGWTAESPCCKDSCGNCIGTCSCGGTWQCIGGDSGCADANGNFVCCIAGRGGCPNNVDACDGGGCCPEHSAWSAAQHCCQVNGVCVPSCSAPQRLLWDADLNNRAGGYCCATPDRNDCGGGTGSGQPTCDPNPCKYDKNNDRKLAQEDVNLWREACIKNVPAVTRTVVENGVSREVVVTPATTRYVRVDLDGQATVDECDNDVDPNRGAVSYFDEECIGTVCGEESGNWECLILKCLEETPGG